MNIKKIPLKSLHVNQANDRHGELENETSAIAWLFNHREAHMRNLAKDISEQGSIYEPPLVSPDGDGYTVFDGNRRVTCLKLLADPLKAPTLELRQYFEELKGSWEGGVPNSIHCVVEEDRDRLDSILFRRHTGSQNGVGQSKWDDRMKDNFISRTGQGGGFNVADEIEMLLTKSSMLPLERQIPRSTMNRLFSAEHFRNRVGFSVKNKKFRFTHDNEKVTGALARVAKDLASREVVLGHLWDVDGKNSYLDKLEDEGVLPTSADVLQGLDEAVSLPQNKKPKRKKGPTKRVTLIPQKDHGLVWPARLQKHHEIWEELQYSLHLTKHRNAIAVLLRVLLEISIDDYVIRNPNVVHSNDKLAQRVRKVGDHLFATQKIDKKLQELTKKFVQSEHIISADTLHRYVHSMHSTPSDQHLTAIWDNLSPLIVACIRD